MPRFIDTFAVLRPIIPQVMPANQEVDKEASVIAGHTVYRERVAPTLWDKFFWSAMALLLYLVASQVPLYGMAVASQSEGYYIMRMMMASNRATLMELGVSPIITSGMIMSLCMGAKIFDVDFKKPEDQNLVNVMQTTLGVLISLGSALSFVLGGQYGPVAVLGALKCTMLVLQLVFAGIVVLLLDDLLGKGYGLGSGLNLFIVTNVCEGIVWACLSPLTITAGSASSTQFEGAFTHFFYVLMKDLTPKGLWDALARSEHTNLLNVAATIAIFAGVVFVQGWTNETVLFAPKNYAEINKAMDAQRKPNEPPPEKWPRPIPIKLFYTSNMPIMLLSALQSSVYFFSQILHKRYPGNILVKLFGVWEEGRGGRYGSRPVWGLAFLLNPPRDLTTALLEPFHTVFYIAFMLTACALLAGAWVEIMANQSPSAQEKMYTEAFSQPGAPQKVKTLFFEDVGLPARRTAVKSSVLRRKIKTAAALGGMALAVLSVSADLLGAIGSGGGVLMAVTIICDMFVRARKENPDEFRDIATKVAEMQRDAQQAKVHTN